MSSHLVASNAFMAFCWLILTILVIAVVGPALVDGADGDPEVHAAKDALVGAALSGTFLFLLAYVAAAVGTGLEQPWGHGLTMALLPITMLLVLGIPIAIWQWIVLIRKPA